MISNKKQFMLESTKYFFYIQEVKHYPDEAFFTEYDFICRTLSTLKENIPVEEMCLICNNPIEFCQCMDEFESEDLDMMEEFN